MVSMVGTCKGSAESLVRVSIAGVVGEWLEMTAGGR
jgi:hypothetical protein